MTDSASPAAAAQRKQTTPERNDINKTIEDMERLFQTVIDAVDGEVFVKDSAGKYLYVNKVFGDDFGVDPKEVIGKDDIFVFGADAAAQLRKNDQRVMASKKAEKVEEQGFVKGKPVTYLTHKTPLANEKGRVTGICGIGYDITPQVEMKEKIRLSEEKYQNLIQNSFDVFYSVTPDGTLTFVGPQVKRFGYEPGELISRNYMEFVAPEHRPEVTKSFEKGTKDGTSLPTQFEFIGVDGNRHWVEVVGKIIYDNSGTPTSQIGVLRDISERKQAEEALKKAHDNLEKRVEERTEELNATINRLTEAEIRYRTVADFTYDWEYWTRLDGILEYVSPSCERISGYNASEFMENPSLYRDIVLAEDRDIWDAHYIDSRNEPTSREIQFRIRHRNGAIRWLEHVCLPVIGQNGELMGFRASNRDITTRKESEIKLQKAYSEIERLKAQLEADRTYLREEIKLEHDHEHIIGNSDVLKYVLFRAEQVAPTDTTVLLLGESGTGKELVARAIHNASPRKDRPLIKVDCASLPPNLIESELFGHEKGAFTHAVEKRIGRFELADGATLFLDEIGELPPQLQPKLLRVLQDGTFERLGSSKTRHTDVRIIAATNRDLETDVQNKKFRMDLWYRLNVFTISIPPLRERVDDIPLLVSYMIRQYERKFGKRIESVPSSVLTHLREYDWPGNVRELENVIERAVITSEGSTLKLEASLKNLPSTVEAPADTGIKSLTEMERNHILTALRKTGWRIHGEAGAAAVLDINPSTLRGRMRKHGIKRPS